MNFTLRHNAIIKGIAPFLTLQSATLITLTLAVLIGFRSLTLATVNPRYALWLVPVIISYGGIIEFLRPYANREADWGDFWFNIMGAFI